jgi:cytidylate kinase
MRELAERILAVERPHPVRVAIDGCSAAGKTTFADGLVGLLGSTLPDQCLFRRVDAHGSIMMSPDASTFRIRHKPGRRMSAPERQSPAVHTNQRSGL